MYARIRTYMYVRIGDLYLQLARREEAVDRALLAVQQPGVVGSSGSRACVSEWGVQSCRDDDGRVRVIVVPARCCKGVDAGAPRERVRRCKMHHTRVRETGGRRQAESRPARSLSKEQHALVRCWVCARETPRVAARRRTRMHAQAQARSGALRQAASCGQRNALRPERSSTMQQAKTRGCLGAARSPPARSGRRVCRSE